MGGAIVESTSAGGAVVNSTSAGGGVVNSTSSGGGSTQTSSSGGGSTQTSTSGGGGSFTSEAGGGAVPSTTQKSFAEMHLMSGVPENSVGSENWGHHLHEVVIPGDAFSHSHTVNVPSHKHQVNIPAHSHSVTIPAHTHSVQIPNHTHQINIPNHTHEINIPNHTHTISLPDHTHDIQHGIYKLSEKPGRVNVKVDGNLVPVDSTSAQNINLIPYLSKDGGGKVERNKWHTVTITPDKLGRVNANIITRLFIQSRIGGTF